MPDLLHLDCLTECGKFSMQREYSDLQFLTSGKEEMLEERSERGRARMEKAE